MSQFQTKIPGLEKMYSDAHTTPEARLWAAVIATAITDAQSFIDQAAIVLAKGIDPRPAREGMRRLLVQMQSEWFETICSFVDTHPDWVVRLIKERARIKGIDLNKMELAA